MCEGEEPHPLSLGSPPRASEMFGAIVFVREFAFFRRRRSRGGIEGE